jgi:hypothetical protein
MVFNEFDLYLAQQSMTGTEGKMSIPLLVTRGMPEHRDRALVEAWVRSNWLRQDPSRQNARFITTKSLDLLSNCVKQARLTTKEKR